LKLGFLTREVKISSRKMLAVTVLSSTSFAWSFFMVYSFATIFESFAGSPFWAYLGEALFFSFGALSAIIGSTLSERIARRKLLLFWITLGVVASASLVFFAGTVFILLSSVLLGLSLGLGYPSFTAFLADSTVVEERARVSGIVILLTFVLVVLAVIVTTTLSSALLGVVLIGVILRSASYFVFAIDPCGGERGKQKSWRAVLAYRDFSLYLFPWLMFSIATGLTLLMLNNLPAVFNAAVATGSPLHYIGAGVAGIISGFAADRLGRKQPIIFGLIALGVAFAFLGFGVSDTSVIVYYTVSGIAWGLLMVIYLAVPGDLAPVGSQEKFYALGITIPIIITMGFEAISQLINFGNVFISQNILPPVLCMIIFLSIIPVLRAREVLSEKRIYERKMKDHVDKIRELVEESKKKSR